MEEILNNVYGPLLLLRGTKSHFIFGLELTSFLSTSAVTVEYTQLSSHFLGYFEGLYWTVLVLMCFSDILYKSLGQNMSVFTGLVTTGSS